MHQYKFTIVTVCYNAEQFIRKTIQSVKMQKFQDFEYIIVDGSSVDQTMEIVHSELDSKKDVKIVSEKDSGIYDAMNKAVDITHGEYVLFLNAGDELCDCFVLDKIDKFISENDKIDIIYGNILLVDKEGKTTTRIYSNICSKKYYLLSGDCICHQALLTKKELLKEHRFDLRYKVCADKEWQLYQMSQKRKFHHQDLMISKVLVEGFSTSNVELFEQETIVCLKCYFHKLYYVYQVLLKIKSNSIVANFITKSYNIIFLKK